MIVNFGWFSASCWISQVQKDSAQKGYLLKGGRLLSNELVSLISLRRDIRAFHIPI